MTIYNKLLNKKEIEKEEKRTKRGREQAGMREG